MTNNKQNTTLDRLRTALDTLAKWPDVSWDEVSRVAGEVVPLVWTALKDHGVWYQLEPADRAALYWSLSTGQSVQTHRPSPVADWRTVLDELSRECAYFAVHCEGKHERWAAAEGRYEEKEGAAQLLDWYQGYTPAWRPEVFRILETEHQTLRHREDGPPVLSHVLSRVHDRVCDRDTPRPDEGHYGHYARTALRLASLPEGWQIETMRRIAAGTLPGHAVDGAFDAINLLPRHGVELSPMPPP
ncbi:hypothetical protein [Streptomyces sp. NBC_00690]|uniref:hypothetical protein n=1 Tax=Streptomyces sp. NBC_00690 TaxID=2975808 RepID=UPI002E2B5BB8|nr:hypothetical protein [Streptomyces sp. NBC_00690]